MKGFFKKCFENLKLIAPITAIGAVLLGILAGIIWLIFKFLPGPLACVVFYLVMTLAITLIFTWFVYDGSSEAKEEKKKKEEDDYEPPVLPFMPTKDDK